MKPRLFCSDLDSCLNDSIGPLLTRINADLGLNLTRDDFVQWEIEPLIEGHHPDPSAYIKGIFDDPDWFLSYPVLLPALTAMQKIRGMVDAVHIVTSRRPAIRDQTLAWLDHYGFPYDKVVLTEEKARYCREVGARFIFEDAPHHAEECLSYGIGVFLMDTPYNQGVRARGGLWRITNPLEIIPILKHELQ